MIPSSIALGKFPKDTGKCPQLLSEDHPRTLSEDKVKINFNVTAKGNTTTQL
jgi:hypothetical protein